MRPLTAGSWISGCFRARPRGKRGWGGQPPRGRPGPTWTCPASSRVYCRSMRRMIFSAVALLLLGATARAQDTAVSGRCATPDTIVFLGAERTGDATIRAESGLVPGPVNYRTLERAIKAIYATGQYDDVAGSCELSNGKAALTISVKERPLLGAVDVTATDRLSRNSVRDKVDLLVGKAVDPAQVAHAVKRIDSLYQASGYYLARVKPETTVVNGQVNLLFRVDEGRRLAVSGVRVEGNQTVS